MVIESWTSISVAVIYFILIICFAISIVMQRRPVGVSLSWLVLLFALPLFGMIAYLVLGGQLLGYRAQKRVINLYPGYHQWRVFLSRQFSDSWQGDPIIKESRLYHFVENSMDMPALPGNDLELCLGSTEILERLLEDIQQAKSKIHIQFYIWWPEGEIEKITQALIDAAKRGVECKVLVDAVGSHRFLNSEDLDNLRSSGIQVEESLPAGPVRIFLERIDLRNHRKIVTIDEKIAWTGSFNLIDPAQFKQQKKLGEWIDAMVRITGPSVFMINAVFLWDWQLSTGDDPRLFTSNSTQNMEAKGKTFLHVLPSSPRVNRGRLHQALLTAIYESKEEIIITTPYFVPDDALFSALISAAKRGVKVCIILPKTTDSVLARLASRSYYLDLLKAGAEICLFKQGLLHTKCVLIDMNTVLFGSVNMDMRSVWLNMELTLVIYSSSFAKKIHKMIEMYRERTMKLDVNRWKKRNFIKRLGESIAQLASPLL